MKTLLHLQDLVKSFDHQIVLNHVSFELQTGEIIGLIGPSGAGKSTMIKTALGMEKADGGVALVLNLSLIHISIRLSTPFFPTPWAP